MTIWLSPPSSLPFRTNNCARRLHTVLEKPLEEISFSITDRADDSITADAACVSEKSPHYRNKDALSQFIL